MSVVDFGQIQKRRQWRRRIYKLNSQLFIVHFCKV